MNQNDLLPDELATLLGYQPVESPPSADAPESSVNRQRARRTNGPFDSVDPWQSIGRGEALDELPFSANIRFTLLSICEEFADRLQLRLSEQLRASISVKNESIIADTFAAHVLRMPQPTCLAVAAISPIEAKLLLELPCGVTFPLLERLLGGQPGPCTIPARPLTDLELRVVGRVLDTMFATWSSAWQSILPFHALLERVESNPRVVRCLPAGTPILVASFSLAVADVGATFRLALPIRTAVEACGGQPNTFVGPLPCDDHLAATTRKEVPDDISSTLRAADAGGHTDGDSDLAAGRQPRYRGTYVVLQGRSTIRTDETTTAE